MNASEQIYEAAKKIPKGKVITYKALGQLSGIKNSRVVGNALHKNPDPSKIPCHRVVNSQGKLAEHFAFGGLKGQKEKLEKEGVSVHNFSVDLTKYLWRI